MCYVNEFQCHCVYSQTPDASGSVDAAKGDTDLRNAPPPLGRQLSEDEMASVAERARQSEQKTIDVSNLNCEEAASVTLLLVVTCLLSVWSNVY